MKRKLILTNDLKAEIARLYQDFQTIRQISNEYNIHPRDILAVLKEKMVKIRRLKKLRPEQEQSIISLYNQNHSINKLSVSTGLSREVITRILRENNIKIRNNYKLPVINRDYKIIDFDGLNQEQEQEIIRKYKAGIPTKEIAPEYKIGRHLIFKILRRYNIEKNKIDRRNNKITNFQNNKK